MTPVESTTVVATRSPVEAIPPVTSAAPAGTVDPVDPPEPVADDSVPADLPDTATGEEHLIGDDEGRPGPAV